MTSITVTEFLRGARFKRLLQALELRLSHIALETVQPAAWQSAGHDLRQLAAPDVNTSTTDALIATLARRLGATVLTRDAQFTDFDVGLA